MKYLEKALEIRNERLLKEEEHLQQESLAKAKQKLEEEKLEIEKKLKTEEIFLLLKQFDGFDINRSGKKLKASFHHAGQIAGLQLGFIPLGECQSNALKTLFSCAYDPYKKIYILTNFVEFLIPWAISPKAKTEVYYSIDGLMSAVAIEVGQLEI